MGEIKRFLFSLLKVKKRKFMRLWKSYYYEDVKYRDI